MTQHKNRFNPIVIALVVLLSGATAGWALVGLLTVYSLARGLCSVSAKDVLGKTVSKSRRGTLMGYSAGIAGLATLGLGIYLEYFRGAVGTARSAATPT